MGPKSAFFGAMDCSLRDALRKEQSVAPPKTGNDGRIEESSRRLQWSDITGILDLITLYNMFTRADIQSSKEALQISLMTQEIFSNVVAFLTKGAHTLEVLPRVHPSALLMMHTCHNLWGVSSKKKSITGNTGSMSTQQMTLSWTGTPLLALTEEKLILPLLTIDQSKMCKENMNLPCVALF